MVLPLLGAAIAGGAALAGSYMTSQSNKDAIAAQQQMAAANIAYQKEFAQSGIQWKVADAMKAGIHPLYALGAQTHSFSPVAIGMGGDTSMGSGLAAAGQHIGRALSAAGTQKERDALMGATSALQLENQQLQNDYLRSRIALTRSQIGPPMPAPEVAPDPFSHPMAKKPEENPWIKFGGTTVQPSGEWSPMKAVQDRYGDEGPVSWGASFAVAMADAEKHFGPVSTWPKQVAEHVAARIWRELKGGEFIRFERPWWLDYIPKTAQ